jgi:uncharacterized membrane protein
MNGWYLFTSQTTSAAIAAFAASFVEFVEALTIVLAVGSARGWKPALGGAFAGAGLLLVLVLTFGATLQNIPLKQLQFTIGFLLLLFGMRWLRKAMLRSLGVIPLHDETKAFDEQTRILRQKSTNFLPFLTSFKAVTLEGIEVVFIVIAVGSPTHSIPATACGAAAAALLVVLLGLLIHRPLARVPENTLKYGVGILLCAFGTYWVGEGLGCDWPGDDYSILGLITGYFAISALVVKYSRPTRFKSSAT